METPDLSIIVPCYNEQEVIDITIARLGKVMDSMEPTTKSELIFVNDGSTDTTSEHLAQACQADRRIRVITFSRNFGHQSAVTAGLNRCRGQKAVILDADLQDPPELIPKMMEIIDSKGGKEGKAQVVYGMRTERQGETWFKRTTAKVFYRLLNKMSEVRLPLDTGDFRMMDRKVIDHFNKLTEHNKYIRGLTAWVGFRQVAMPYKREARAAGETKYPLSKMIRLSMASIISFSTKPLKMVVVMGILAEIVAFGLLLWSVLGKIFGFTHADSGWTSIFVLVIFFGGLQLITTGIVGLYVGSIFDEVKRRPEYIIDTEEGGDGYL